VRGADQYNIRAKFIVSDLFHNSLRLHPSSQLLLNQTAFILVVSVLIDTFVVRTVLVPILLGVTRSQSWWPRSLPEIRVDLEQRRKEKEVRRGEGEESAVLVSA
jgi:uncharacterized membrane protein YdfJ with MMPL/SSD domain